MNRRPRVLSHPPRHPYVDRFDDTVSRVVHRDEPMPRLDAYHDPDWVRRQRGDWDLVHLHFGHEHHPVERMVDVLDAHRSAGTPIVVTVHDLANPHLRPQDDPSLDLLGPMVERARVVTTLTVGCANAVAAHTGVHPRIIPTGRSCRRTGCGAHGGCGPPAQARGVPCCCTPSLADPATTSGACWTPSPSSTAVSPCVCSWTATTSTCFVATEPSSWST